MDAINIGPVVLSGPRFVAALGFLALIVVAEFGARLGRKQGDGATRREPKSAGWAWNAALAVVLGARAGFVIENLSYFAREPLSAFAFWQGGFSPWWGVAAGVVVAALTLRRQGESPWSFLPAAVVGLLVWLVVPLVLGPASATAVHYPQGSLVTLEGESFAFTEGLEGPVVVNLWASWCIPCRREMPQLARAAEEHPDVLFLYVNQGEERTKVAAFLSDYPGVQLGNVLLDSNGRVGDALGNLGLPTTYFFSSGGTHAQTHVGEISGAALGRAVRALD